MGVLRSWAVVDISVEAHFGRVTGAASDKFFARFGKLVLAVKRCPSHGLWPSKRLFATNEGMTNVKTRNCPHSDEKCATSSPSAEALKPIAARLSPVIITCACEPHHGAGIPLGLRYPRERGDGLSIFLPIAGMSLSLPLLVAIGFVIGFISGLVGVGGGFLLTPILMMAGIPPAVAVGSGTNTVVATSASGMAAHFRLGNVDVRMGVILVLGGLTGGGIGNWLLEALHAMGKASLTITVTYILVLGSLGGYMLVKSLRLPIAENRSLAEVHSQRGLRRLPLQMHFPRSGVRHSVLLPFGVAAMIGVLSAMGMGGGFALVPAMVYLLDVPEHVAVGTSLFGILFTCCGVTLVDATMNHTVDVILVILVAIGSTVGAQIGVRTSVRLRGNQLMVPLAILVLAVAAHMLFRVLRTSSNLLDVALQQYL